MAPTIGKLSNVGHRHILSSLIRELWLTLFGKIEGKFLFLLFSSELKFAMLSENYHSQAYFLRHR